MTASTTMDQDAFRNLLSSSRLSQPKQTVAHRKAAILPGAASSEPAFKPRKVKKAESKYRDRAAERREGIGNDYAHVEAVLDDFQKRATQEDEDVIEQQRKYLGGDSQHTILVKGLDMSLFEQNRARVGVTTEDDEVLEQAFTEATSSSKTTEPRKRTREEIIRDLKAKRQNGDESSDQPVVQKSIEEDESTFEVAKKTGKFRPIGFKPIEQTEGRPKKRRVKEGKEGMKKKQKVEITPVQSGTKDRPAEETPSIPQNCGTREATSFQTPKKPPEPEPLPLDEDFDIFAGAGDYEAFPGDDGSDEEHRDTEDTRTHAVQEMVSAVPAVGAKSWFDEPESEITHVPIPPEKSPPAPETEEEPLRLRPLESSALPSIRDFLAMGEAVEKAEKRKARKEKKKKKGTSGDDDD